MVKRQKVEVAVPVLVRRVKRALAHRDETLRVARDGSYLRIDTRRNVLIDGDADLEALAHELGCLKPWETVAR
jgi:hypothetical protein